MNFQLLPNVFKKIGIFIFVAGGIPSFIQGYKEGRMASEGMPESESVQPWEFIGFTFTEPVLDYLSIFSTIGLLIYLYARDKHFDEFILQLRMEALQLSFLVTALFVFFTMIVFPGQKFGGIFVIQLVGILFIMIYKSKKWQATPDDMVPETS